MDWNVVALKEDRAVVATLTTEGSALLSTGNSIIPYLAGASFDDIAITGTPGEFAGTLVFRPDVQEQAISNWEHVEVQVTIEQCQRGEEVDSGTRRCELCKDNSVKLTIGSHACTSCIGVDGITCLGGDIYRVEDSYWMSPAAEQCAYEEELSGEDARTACVLRLVFGCPYADACASALSRTNNASTMGIQAGRLCSEGYDPEVVYCAGCMAGYTANGGECKKCSVQAWLVWMRAGTVLFLPPLLLLAAYSAHRWASNPANRDKARWFMGQLEEIGVQLKLRTMFSIFLAFMQVTGQTSVVYEREVLPSVYWEFLRFPDVFNVSVLSWIDVECLDYHLGTAPESSLPFAYLQISFSAAIPVALMLLGSWLWMVGAFRHIGRDTLRGSAKEEFWNTYNSRQSACSAPNGSKLLSRQFLSSRMDVLPRSSVDVLAESAASHHSSMASLWGGNTRPMSLFTLEQVAAVYSSVVPIVLIYLHPSVSTHMFQTFNCEPLPYPDADKDTYYLVMDYSVECYTYVWWIFAGVSIVTILAYVFGLPICLAAITYSLNSRKEVVVDGETQFVDSAKITISVVVNRNRQKVSFEAKYAMQTEHGPITVYPTLAKSVETTNSKYYASIPDKSHIKSRLDNPIVRSLLGALVTGYKRQYCCWESWEITRRLLQTSVIILMRIGDKEIYLYYSVLIAGLSLILHMNFQPYRENRANRFQTMVLMSQCYVAFGIFIVRNDTRFVAFIGNSFIVIQVLGTPPASLRFCHALLPGPLNGSSLSGLSPDLH
ncbi:hypothetical protein CYMTET_50909 [Cymbomonas tetramitiformis]|uniref:Uncharacterized protein n=1 Tax=Cymbomonas tetramitiformis TaxID=36881 RepID=A0AAE0BM40_9CHLO|nr:hypothetical protein CYMTET_50909 [Cymbomonas tetramitiformis]